MIDFGEVSTDLSKPFSIGIGRYSRKFDSSSLEFHDDKYVHRHQPLHRPDFDRSEIDSSDRLPMGFQKCLPRGSPFPFWSRFDAVFSQKIPDGLIAERMPQVSQRTLDPLVTPRRIFAEQTATRDRRSLEERQVSPRPCSASPYDPTWRR